MERENLDIRIPARNKWSYSIGCIGRDMCYTLVSYFIVYFLTNGIGLKDWELGAVTVIMVIARFWDAVNDPMMGTIVDNTRSRWGKFKPWIMTGALLNSIFVFLLFLDYGFTGVPYLALFTVIYVLWGMTYTMNDISYWAMMPSFSADPKERESVGSLARIFASVGMFVVIALTPVLYGALTVKRAFLILASVIPIIFILCQALVCVGVKERKSIITSVQNKTTLKGMFRALLKNDQLLAMVVSILLFNVGYYVTTAFGPYFFDYTFGDYGGMSFTLFSVVLAVAQIVALALYPVIAKRIPRKRLYLIAVILVAAGYAVMMSAGYLLPLNMIVVGVSGLFIFFGQALIQVLCLVMLADTIEYGQWKLGTRNESAVFALQPFVTKMASSIQVGIVSLTLIVSGLNRVSHSITQLVAELKDGGMAVDSINEQVKIYIANNVTDGMNLILRISMIILPTLLILLSYLVFRRWYKLDEERYRQIIGDLKERAAADNDAQAEKAPTDAL